MKAPYRFAVRLLGTGGAIATLGSCESGEITFPTQPVACSISPHTQLVGSTRTLTPAEAEVAIQDIASRILPTWPDVPERVALVTRLAGVRASIGQASALSQCLGVESARRALAAIGATPETAADRMIVEMTLDLLATTAAQATR